MAETIAFARPKPATNYRRRQEETLQLQVCRYIRREYPHVIFCSDFAAGLDLRPTQRIKMMAMRSDDGQPDISIDFPSRGFHGLRIELKKEGTILYKRDGSLRKQPYTRRYKLGGKIMVKRGDHLAEQATMLDKYRHMGYCAEFAVGFDEAIRLIDWYFERPEQSELF